MMRHPFKYLAAVLALGLMCGCEWETSSDSDSWNDAYSWVNFSGTYRPPSGNTYVVSEYAPGTDTPASTKTRTDSIGTGDGLTAGFSGTLSKTPVVAGTVSVSSGAFSLADNGDGALTGDGSGSINYDTGAITVNFTLAPGAGNSVQVT